MSLVHDFFEKCILMEKRRVPDGRGGWIVEWTDGESFDAAITYNTSTEGKIAQAQGVKDLISVTTETLELDYHDVFRKVDGGQTYRVTTKPDNNKPPKSASGDIRKLRIVEAEEYELTGD